MCMLVNVSKSRSAIRFALAGLTAALLAGCSAGMTRSGDPFANPFQQSARFSGSDRTATGSVARTEAAPVSRVISRPLDAPVSARPLAPVRPTYGKTALAVPSHPSPAMRSASASHRGFDSAPTSRIERGDRTASTSHGVWNAEGGTSITVRPGDTARVLATRYEVPLDDLLRVNGLRSAAQVRPGARLVIPVYSADGANRRIARKAPTRSALLRRPVETHSRAHEKFRFVKGPSGAQGRHKFDKRSLDKFEHGKAAEKDHFGRHAEREEHARKEQFARKSDSSRETKAARILAMKEAKEHAQALKTAQTRSAELKRTAQNMSKASAAHRAVNDSTTTGSLPPPQRELASIAPTKASARPRFGWPARGRIIEGFKSGSNDGINIAVPDGTIVKAAADGVVAYAGDELKGYGNLVLIRHPNGFVSAYADNGELDVKRGQMVKRGQAIAKSGQSGNVSSPQLHFELRKGQTPVNPTRYLAGL